MRRHLIINLAFLALLPTAGMARNLNVVQNSAVNIWSFYQDSGSIDTATVNQSGKMNVIVNDERNGSQALLAHQSGEVNYLYSSQVNLNSTKHSVNVVVATQSNGAGASVSPSSNSSSKSTRASYHSQSYAGGYLSTYVSANLNIEFYGPKNSVSTIGRHY